MRITREWQHDDHTEELGNVITEALERAEAREELHCEFWSDEGGTIQVRLPDSDRRFRLVLEEIV